MHLHNVLDLSQPALARLKEIPSRADTARPAFTSTIGTKPAQAGPLTNARVNGGILIYDYKMYVA